MVVTAVVRLGILIFVGLLYLSVFLMGAVVVGYWWLWCPSGVGGGDNSLCKGGSCNSCSSAILGVQYTVMVVMKVVMKVVEVMMVVMSVVLMLLVVRKTTTTVVNTSTTNNTTNTTTKQLPL